MNRCHIKTKIFRKQISGLPDHFGVRAAVCKPVIFFQFKPTHINPGFFNQAFKRKWTGIPERETAILRVLETRGGCLPTTIVCAAQRRSGRRRWENWILPARNGGRTYTALSLSGSQALTPSTHLESGELHSLGGAIAPTARPSICMKRSGPIDAGARLGVIDLLSDRSRPPRKD